MKSLGLLLFICSFSCKSQTFLNQWIGNWQGELLIHSINGSETTVDMGLEIQSLTDSSWQWKITYKMDTVVDVRDYVLLKKANSPHYVIDENNGIELYLSPIKNGFYSSFSVGESELLILYELVNKKRMVFRTIASGLEKQTGPLDTDYVVYTRKTFTSQIAHLKRK